METDDNTPAPPAEVVPFERIRLVAGDALRIHQRATNKRTHAVQFIGALVNAGIITSLPVANGRGLWMPPGSEYVGHILSGTYVYGFATHVLRARANPYPHVHFAYPVAAQRRQVRRARRLTTNLAVELVAAGSPPIPATLLDLSLNGALLETTTALAGDEATLTLPIDLDEASSHLQLRLKVRSQPDTAANRPLRYGVEITELSKQDALLLHYFIDHSIVEGR